MTHFSIVPPVGASVSRVRPARKRLWASSALVAAAILPGAAFAGPQGGKVVAGDAVISQSGAVTSIQQNSARTVIEWDNFDTAAGEATRFAQPDAKSVAVNRITGELPTHIRGELTANGNIWVINRSGITFHDTSRVNVGGLVATTSDIDTGKFMAGSNTFDIPGKPGASVVNKGSITFGEAGLAALVGAQAANEGVIYGRLGAVAIEGRQTFAVDVSGGDGILALETSAGTAAVLSASNTGVIDAGGSYVVISAEETAAALESLATAGGTIKAGAVDGHLGQVAIKGRTAVVSGEISAAGGAVDVRGDAVTMTAGASIDVSGAAGGGTVALGGGLRGEGRRADTVVMHDGATIAADGLGDASGGLVTLWSTDFTGFAGDISARGGDFGGDGGFVEVSAAGAVGFWGDVVTLAPFGTKGTLLLDPTNIEITDAAADDSSALADLDDAVDTPGTTQIHTDRIEAITAGNTLILEATDNITVDSVLTGAAGNITLRAGLDIFVNVDLITTGSLTLSADHDFSIATGTSVVPGDAASDTFGSIVVANGADVTGTTGLTMTVGTAGLLSVTGSSTFTSGAALVLPTTTVSGAASAASFVTTAGGGISQAGDFTALGTTTANFTSFAGVDLTTHTNDILSLSGSSDDNASFTLGSTVAFGFSTTGDVITLSTTGAGASVTTNAGQAVAAATLTLAVDGSVALTEATNSIAAVDGTTSGTFTIVNNADLALGFATTVPTAMDITTTAGSGTGALTQSTDISSALTLDVAGAATLTRTGNTFASLTADTGAASSFVSAATLDLGASAFTDETSISATGVANDLTQSAAITVTGGQLTAIAGRNAVLGNAGNAFSSLAGSAGNTGTFETTTGLSLTYTSMGALDVTTGGNLTSGGPVNAGGLVLDVTGTAVLGNPTNTVGALTGTVSGALSYVDDGALSLGITADTMTVTSSGGAITDGAGAVITTGATTDGAASFFAFADNVAGDVSDDAYFSVTFSDAGTSFDGDLSVSGAAIDIAATGALSVVDAYAANTARFASDGALTLSRVAVGTEAGASGADLTIDTPGDLLAIGTSVTATDIIAADVTLGGAGSVIGTANALTTTASITRFAADTLTIGDATATTAASGVLSTGLDAGDSGALTVASLDMTGAGAVVLAQSVGTMTVNGLIADSIDLTAGDIDLGFVSTAGTFDAAATAAAGSIMTISDGSVTAPANAVIAAPVLAAAAGPDITDAAAAYAAPTRLLDIGGAASFDGANAIFLLSTPDGGGFDNDFADAVTFTDVSGGGVARVAVQDANDFVIGGIGTNADPIQFVAIAAGVGATEAGSITQTGTAHVSAELTLIAGDDGAGGPLGDVTMTLVNELNEVAVRALDAAVTSSTDFEVAGTLDGDATVLGAGMAVAELNRLTAVNATITADTTNVLHSALSGTLDQTTTGVGNISMLNFTTVTGLATLGGQGTTQVFRSQLGGLDATVATGVLYLEDSVLGAVDASAGSGLIDNISATDFSLFTTGSVELGPATITNDLAIESSGGSIIAADSASFGASAHVPGAVPGGGTVPVVFGIDTSADTGNVADDRVQFTSAGISLPGTTPTAVGDGLIVGGDALLIAGDLTASGDFNAITGTQDVILAPGGDGLVFDFQGAVTARVDGDFTIQDDAGGILFDVPSAGVTTPSGAVINDDGGTVGEDAAVSVIGALSVTTTGAGGDVVDAPDDTPGVAVGTDAFLDSILVSGTAVFDLSGDLLLDGIDGNSTHFFGNTVTVTAADDVILTVDGDLDFGDVTADSLIARSTGNIGDGAGTMTIAGAAAFLAVDDNNTADLSDDSYGGVTLDNGVHDFNGDVSAAGSFVTIDAGDDLSLVDVWGHTGLDVSAVGSLDMTRVAAGSGTIAAGDTDFAIDAPAAIAAAASVDITVTDIIGSSLTLRNLAAGDPDGDISVTRFALDTLDFGTPAAGLTLADGVLTGALTLNAPGDLAVINIDTGGANANLTAVGTLTVSGLTADNLTITAADARLGFLDIATGLTVFTTGTIEMLPDATLAGLIPTAGVTTVSAPDVPLTVPSTDAGATGVITDETLTTTAMTRLISVGGPTELHATTSIVLAGTTVGGGFENDHLQIAVFDDDGAGTPMTVVIEDANDIALAGVQGHDITIRAGTDAGATGDITQFAGVQSSGTTTLIIEDDGAGDRGAVTLTNGGNAFTDLALVAGDATLYDDSGFNITGAQIDDALTVNPITGPLGLADVTAGSISIDTFGSVTGTRINSADALRIATDGTLSLTDTVAVGDTDLAAVGTITLDRFALAALSVVAGADLDISNGAAGAVTTPVGSPAAGTITFDNVAAASIDVMSAAEIRTRATRTVGDMTLNAGLDVSLGRTAVGGALAIESQAGSILTVDGGASSSPGAAVTVIGAQAVTVGTDASAVTGGTAERVTATLTGSNDTDIASPGITDALQVTDGAYFVAFGGDASLVTASDGALAVFDGAVFLAAINDATIEAAGDLTFAQTRATLLGGGVIGGNIAVAVNGNLLARANADGNVGTGADITQTGFMDVVGTSSFISGVHSGGVVTAELGSVTLNDAENRLGGAVTALGNDVAVTADTNLLLDDVRAFAAGGGAGDVVATSGGLIDANNVGADGLIDLTATDALTMTDVTAGTTLTGAAGGDVIGTDIGGGGAIDLSTTLGSVDVLRVTGGDALALAATTTLDATDVAVDGAAVLDAGGAMGLDNVDAGTGTLIATAAGDILAGTVDADGAMSIASSGGAVDAAGLTTGSTLGLSALTTLDAATVAADGATVLGSGGAMTLSGVDAGTGTLTATAAGDILAGTVDADGAMSIASSGGAVDAAGLTTGSTLGLSALTTLDAATVAADGATVLDAGGAMTLSGVDAGTGTLAATAGGDVLAGTVDADGAMSIASTGGAVTATGLTTGSTLDLDALTSLDATTVAADGATVLDAGGAMTLSGVDAGTGTLAATAGGGVLAGTVDADGAMSIASTGGAVTATGLTTGSTLDLDALTTLSATTVTADGATVLGSGTTMTLTDIDAGAGTLAATAGGDLTATAGTMTSGSTMTIASTGGSVAASGLTSGGALDVDANAALGIADADAAGLITADAVNGAITVLRVAGDDAAIMSAGGALTAEDLGVAGDLALTAGATSAIADMTLTRVAAGGGLVAGAGDAVTGIDVQSAGAMIVSGGGIVDLTGVEAATTFVADAGGSIAATDINVGDAAALTAGGDAAFSKTAAGDTLTAGAGGDVIAADLQSVGSLILTSTGGAIQANRVVTDAALTISAADALEVDRAASGGDTQLIAGSGAGAGGGDLRLAGIQSGGVLAAESGRGAIRTFATAAGDTVEAPIGVADGFDGVSSGLADAADQALTAPTQVIDVTGAALFSAAGDIALARAGGLDNLFAAGIAAEAGGDMLIHHDGDLTVGTGAPPPIGPAIADGLTTTGAGGAGHARLELQGATLTTAAGAVHDIAGDYTIAAGLGGGTVDVTIDNLMNVDTLEVMARGGAVTIDSAAPSMGLVALADDIDITSTGNVGLGSVIARRLVVDAAGADATTIGDEAQTVTRLGVDFTGTNGAAVLNDAGTGAADYALSASAAAAMAAAPSVVVTESMRITQSGAGAATIALNDFSNMFPADMALNVGGGISLFAERTLLAAAVTSYAESLGLGETGLLQFSDFASGGDVNIYTVGQIQFMDDVGFAAGASVDLWITADPAADPSVTAMNQSIIFRGDVGGIGGQPDVLFETPGDIFMFGAVGAGGPGNAFQPLGSVELIGNDIVAGAVPANLGSETGLLQETDLDDFITALGVIGEPAALPGTDPGNLGAVVYQIEDGGDQFDYFRSRRLGIRSDGGAVMFVINREDAGGAFEDALSFYGVNIASDVRYGSGPLGIAPLRLEMYGSVDGDRSRSAGLRVEGPIGNEYFFNGCLVKQTATCTNLGTTISVPPLPPIDVPVFELATLDLNELFGAIGNEDLWRLPPAYISDEDLDDQEGTN